MKLDLRNTSKLSRKYSSLFKELAYLPLYPYAKTFSYFLSQDNAPFEYLFGSKENFRNNFLAALLLSFIFLPLSIFIHIIKKTTVPLLICMALTVVPVLPIMTLLGLGISILGAALTAVSALVTYPIALTMDLLGLNARPDYFNFHDEFSNKEDYEVVFRTNIQII